MVEEDNRRLGEALGSCLEDLHHLRTVPARTQTVSRTIVTHSFPHHCSQAEAESPVRSHSFKWASFVKPSKSPTKAVPEVESPQASPQRMEHDIHGTSSRQISTAYTEKSRNTTTTLVNSEPSTSAHTSYSTTSTLLPNPAPPRPQRQESQDNLKSFKVSLDDPAWKVLPAALKKYKINNDDWQNYAMFICYGAAGQ